MPEDNEEKGLETITINLNEFSSKVVPKKLEDDNKLFLFKCYECGGMHFRHAGYFEMIMPYVRADQSRNVSTDSYSVKVCVKCRTCYIWINDQVYDVTKQIDLEAWEKFEQEVHKATGPGGNC
jgi:hypothetical protein